MRGARASGSTRPARPTLARGRIKEAIRLANAAAADADDEGVTPSAIAQAIEAARRALGAAADPRVEELLREARDSVDDGLPPDTTSALLYRAASRLG
ncbi:MAG: hypothetical protein WAM30_06785 [Candidatus Dormiibacterota bacterium]